MAISVINQHRNDLAKQFIDASPLNADTKSDLDELLDASLRTTNGLQPDEKLDAIADNLYQLTRLTCIHIAEKPKPAATWKDVLIRCPWQAVVVVAITVPSVVALFIYQPQLAAILEHLVPK